MADISNSILNKFSNEFCECTLENLTLENSGLNDAEIAAQKACWTDRGKKFEKDLIKNLKAQLDKSPVDLKCIKQELQKLQKHTTVPGSVFVGINTAKYWQKMIKHIIKLEGDILNSVELNDFDTDTVDKIISESQDNAKQLAMVYAELKTELIGINRIRKISNFKDLLNEVNKLCKRNNGKDNYLKWRAAEITKKLHWLETSRVAATDKDRDVAKSLRKSLQPIVIANGGPVATNVYFSLICTLKF